MRVFLLALFTGAFCAAQEGVPLFTPDFPPEEFAARRAKVYDAIGPNGIAVVQGAPLPSTKIRFRQTNEFFHLCGVESPHAYLVLDGARRKTTLFLQHRNEAREAIDGRT